jgi:hypothetical protein
MFDKYKKLAYTTNIIRLCLERDGGLMEGVEGGVGGCLFGRMNCCGVQFCFGELCFVGNC